MSPVCTRHPQNQASIRAAYSHLVCYLLGMLFSHGQLLSHVPSPRALSQEGES